MAGNNGGYRIDLKRCKQQQRKDGKVVFAIPSSWPVAKRFQISLVELVDVQHVNLRARKPAHVNDDGIWELTDSARALGVVLPENTYSIDICLGEWYASFVKNGEKHSIALDSVIAPSTSTVWKEGKTLKVQAAAARDTARGFVDGLSIRVYGA